MADAVRVFIGAAANNEDIESQAVLEWSIRKHASRPVEITWMQQTHDRASVWGGWNTSRWATPFTGFRWAIPAACGFEGKAIYMDSDMIVNADLAELIDQEHGGALLLAKGGGQWRICVSVWDCAAARSVLPSLEALKADPAVMPTCTALVRGRIRSFSGEWNCLDRELNGRRPDDPSVKILHYTDMRSQPQLRHAVPRLAAVGGRHWYDGNTTPHKFPAINEYFDALLAEAVANGYPPERYIREPFGPYRKKSYAGR